MTAPKHQTQLTGIATESVDCGVRTTSMMIDWATRGIKRPTVKVLRSRMGLSPTALTTTDPVQWAKAVESYDTPVELGGRYERLTGETVVGGGWGLVAEHLAAGHLVGLAVDYGAYRRSMPRKAGSTSFDGYHAIPFRPTDDRTVLTSYDPLLDGRYRGCPSGPVRVPLDKVRRAAEEVGRKEVGRPVVYGYLPERGTRLGSGVDIPEPEEPVTLSTILADLYEARDEADQGPVRFRIASAIEDLEALMGPYQGVAEPDDDPVAGVKPE